MCKILIHIYKITTKISFRKNHQIYSKYQMQKFVIVNRANESTSISRKRTPTYIRGYIQGRRLHWPVIQAMLIPYYATRRSMLPLYYGSRKKIIGRSGHYGDIIPLGLKVYFLLVVAMTAPVPVGRPAGLPPSCTGPSLQSGKTTPRLTDEDYRFGTWALFG